MMKVLAIVAALVLATPTFAASPVTINNANNTSSAAVTNGSLSVICTSGCSGSGGGGGPPAGASTDASGTVTTGNTYQQIIASNASRKGCTVQNPPTATENLSVRVGATTVFGVVPGGSLNCGSTGVIASDAIFVTAATTGHAFSANFQ